MVEVNVIEQIYQKFLEKKIAHAFLFETNNVEKAFLDILSLIKKMSCEDNYIENCNKCNLCHLIDTNNLPSLQIIEPEGKNIKKEQIIQLKDKFKFKPIYTKTNFYIIKNADKLNESSSNTMLKFLEEPNQNIIGFFLTNNRDNVIETIKSRCQIYTYNFVEVENFENKEKIEEIIYNYIVAIEKSTLSAFLLNRELINSEFIDKDNINLIFKIMSIKYREILFKIFNLYKEVNHYDFLIEFNNSEKIVKKLKIIETTLLKLVYNVNIELLLDKFVIEMRKV